MIQPVGSPIKVNQKLGKYRITRRIAEGGFATVYKAYDTIAGIHVAIKVPHPHLLNKAALEDFRREVRLTAKLDHPNILPMKDAAYIDHHFVIVYALGECSLDERLQKRMSAKTAVQLADQMLEAVAFAHQKHIMHCDIKPDNFILFHGNRLRLADFGIAKVARRTLFASGSGTIGFVAPEQAMGKPSLRSDVFSLGLILCRMFSGHLPEWPFHWPPPGYDRLKKNVHPDLVAVIRRALQVDSTKRYPDASRMLAAFRRVKPHALRAMTVRRKRSRKKNTDTDKRTWETVRIREFLKQYRKSLETRHVCSKCRGPIAEAMQACPWCGRSRRIHRENTRYPARCPRCKRGVKSDWRFCPWCYGAEINDSVVRTYGDVRYVARCANTKCKEKSLMQFMRYCPRCRQKVTRNWQIEGAKYRCQRCRWKVLPEYWDYCPWCARGLGHRGNSRYVRR